MARAPKPSSARLRDLDPELRRDIGRRLRVARELAELSQREMAEKLGCTQGLISHYERAQHDAGLLPLVFAYSGVLNRPVSYFLGLTTPEAEVAHPRDSAIVEMIHELDLYPHLIDELLDYWRFIRDRRGERKGRR